MTDRQITEEKDPGVQQLARLAGTAVLWAVTLVGASWILDNDSASRPLRGGAVLLALAGVLPWIWMVARAIVQQDEFTRRIHFVALSWAFAATGIFVYAIEWLTKAHLVAYVSYTTIWMFMVVAWWLSILFTTRYYR